MIISKGSSSSNPTRPHTISTNQPPIISSRNQSSQTMTLQERYDTTIFNSIIEQRDNLFEKYNEAYEGDNPITLEDLPPLYKEYLSVKELLNTIPELGFDKKRAIEALEDKLNPLFRDVNNEYLFKHHHQLFQRKNALYSMYNRPINHTEIASIMEERATIKEQLDALPENPNHFNKEALINEFKKDSDTFFIKANEALKNKTVYV